MPYGQLTPLGVPASASPPDLTLKPPNAVCVVLHSFVTHGVNFYRNIMHPMLLSFYSVGPGMGARGWLCSFYFACKEALDTVVTIHSIVRASTSA